MNQLLNWTIGLYSLIIFLLAVFGVNLFIALLVSVWHRRSPASQTSKAPSPGEWPTVLVQLPLYNERYVVERIIDAAAALDYPTDRLLIQVLDDSTDDTSLLARVRVAQHRARGIRIAYRHRSHRTGFKAGALAAGLMAEPRAEFIAIFDADFLPRPDYLRRIVPDFLAEPRLGMVQARWEHLNADQSRITSAQALAFDCYFSVEQVARSRAGWPMNFNGSAGVWRRACIEAAGGWQGDTLAEDLDLSYRAYLAGWRLDYRVEADTAVPGELPGTILALKRQQFRWAKGSFQVLRKLWRRLLASSQPFHHKCLGLLHLAGYLPHPLLVLSLLLSLPVVLNGRLHARWEEFGWLGLIPPLATVWGQIRLRRGLGRLRDYPIVVLGMIGLALSNTRAFWEALTGETGEFQRTPKSSSGAAYALPADSTMWGEWLLAIYAFATGLLALKNAPELAPVMFLYALGFGSVAAVGFRESMASPELVSAMAVRGKEGERPPGE